VFCYFSIVQGGDKGAELNIGRERKEGMASTKQWQSE